MLDRYMGAGGNFIDTANFYTKGHSEAIIGEHVGRHPAKRRRVALATKFFSNLFPGDPNAGGTSRKAIVTACEDSLRRLRTDFIDLYWMHCWDPITPIEETMRALDDLVASGKVRYIGFSDTPAWNVAEAQVTARFRSWSPLIALQVEYSLLERTVEGEMVPMALEMGLGVTPWSPLRFGVLTGKHTRESVTQAKPGRGEWVLSSLDEKAFRVPALAGQNFQDCSTRVTPSGRYTFGTRVCASSPTISRGVDSMAKTRSPVKRLGERAHFLLCEVAEHINEHALFVGQAEIHGDHSRRLRFRTLPAASLGREPRNST
jgi:diketogulonate reductase-like aldo/keto reductase